MFFLVCMVMLILAVPASAEDARLDWNSAARDAAVYIEQTLTPREGTVVHIDPDSRHVYFSGLGPQNLAEGAPVQFLTGGDLPVGTGRLVSALGKLSWAQVDTATAARVNHRTRVRLDPALRQTVVLPFVYQDSSATRVSAMASIFRSLFLHDLNERAFPCVARDNPVLMPDSSGAWDTAPLAGAAAAAYVSAVMTESAPGEISVRVDVIPGFAGSAAVSRVFKVTAWPGFPAGAARRGGDEPAHAAGAGTDAPPVPPGVLRITLETMPGGSVDRPFAWPPLTPTDLFLIDALGWSPADFAATHDTVGRRIMRVPDHAPTGFAARAAQSLNQRRDLPAAAFLLGQYEFTAPSETALVLRSDRPADWTAAALADPIFALVDPDDPRGDIGDGPYGVVERTARRLVLARRATLFPEKYSRAAETVVVDIEPDPAARQQRFDLRESDFLQVGDDRFPEYAQSTAWHNRIARTPPAALVILIFHTGHEWTRDPAVRRAIVSHLDRQATLDVLLNGRGRVAEGFGPAALEDRRAISLPRPPGEKSALHRKLTKPVTLTLAAPSESPELKIIAERIQTELKPLGIHVRIPDEPWERYRRRLQSGDFDLALTVDEPSSDARFDLARRFRTDGPENFGRYSGPVFDRLIGDAAFLQQAHDILLIDLPATPLYRLSQAGVWQGRIRSVAPTRATFSIQDFQF